MSNEMRQDEVQMTVSQSTNIQHPSELEHVQIATQNEDGRFAVMAPYWVNGLHNKAGLELAEEINKLVRLKKLVENEEAIKTLLNTFDDAHKYGIRVVPEQKYLDDPHRKINAAEPRFLLSGALVRDKDGAYRPVVGGLAVLMDKGDTLTIKRGHNNLDAAVELAKAKGWTAISLTGKSKAVEAAWISAQLAGIEVINYPPTKEAQAKLAERLAQQCVTTGDYQGKILAIEGNQVVQKIGRNPDVVVRHDISNLSRVPEKNEVVGINYKDGKGIVTAKEIEKVGKVR